MVSQGLLQEVEALLKSGLLRAPRPCRPSAASSFYPSAGETSAEEAVAEVKLRSPAIRQAPAHLAAAQATKIHWILWEKRSGFPAGLQNATEYLTAQGLG